MVAGVMEAVAMAWAEEAMVLEEMVAEAMARAEEALVAGALGSAEEAMVATVEAAPSRTKTTCRHCESWQHSQTRPCTYHT